MLGSEKMLKGEGERGGKIEQCRSFEHEEIEKEREREKERMRMEDFFAS